MGKSQNTPDQDEFDIFIANRIYPDAQGLFAIKIKAIESIKSTCLIVVDTNVLLLPYSTGPESIQRIGDTYRQLVELGQLIVPGQVAREFAKNRATKLTELFQQIVRKGNVSDLQKGKYPLLESVKEYQDLLKIEQEIDKKLVDYRKALGRLKDHIRAWAWDDPVSLLYSELFNENVVFDPDFDQKQILQDLNLRQKHKIPPGFKDADKDDRGVGDILIWYTILKLGQERKSNVLFVTGDEKTDWFYQSEKQALYPRFELIDEFRRESGGYSFYIASFSEFLKLYGASSAVVQEVRQQEVQERIIQREKIFFDKLTPTKDHFGVEQLVFSWLKHKFPNAEVEFTSATGGRDYGLDFIVLDNVTGIIGVEVKYFRRSLKSAQQRLQNVVEKISQYVLLGNFDRFLLVLVSDDFEDAISLRRATALSSISTLKIELAVGYITPDGAFNELPVSS
ncbi:MAG: DUF4935 domain-containing protein [Chloroflexi bacterium]|nr:DUF4935 domain-containing protein [Chloroflexota bacterium]